MVGALMLSDGCAAFVAAHACGEAKQDAALAMIKAALPVITSINWERVPSRLEVPEVGRERLAQELSAIAGAVGLPCEAVLTIVQVDGAVPSLGSRLQDWLVHAEELDFVDTLFLSMEDRVLIHWDFYKSLYAVRF
ncbi:TPA: hypothetical protein QEL43_001905 [Stenotrophomonas maltophilia]|nr:hypothetical protein [Stenotrophomonas maltophilia]MBH1696901.1 hypothetical protein [Stenotrophomonas maltophilia]PJL51558.1 hypothetical protein B9Y74_06055 [Stenotrophomonas maltophilia]HDS1632273.1 hypothetical protein [Stenotrophomonas maltophilia]